MLKRIIRVGIACMELATLFGNKCQCVQIDSTRLQDNNSSGGLATHLDTNPGISMSPHNVLNGQLSKKLPPPFDRSWFFSSCWVFSHPPHQKRTGGGTSLVTDDPTMKQVILGYILPVAL